MPDTNAPARLCTLQLPAAEVTENDLRALVASAAGETRTMGDGTNERAGCGLTGSLPDKISEL